MLGFLGYSRSEAPNIITDGQKCLHENDYPDFQKLIDDLLCPEGEDILAMDCRFRHPDDTWHWFRVRGIVVRNDEGDAFRIVGSIIDISKRKNAERELEDERYRLHELIENIPVNVYYKDKDSKFVLANSSTAAKMGLDSVDDLLGKSDHDFFDASHADVARADEINIMKSRESLINVIERETWEGKEDTWAKISKLPWLDRRGELIGTFGITSDITDLLRTQGMLASLAEEMQTRYKAVEEELQLAREIQQALLPSDLGGMKLERFAREITFGCRYAPASEMAGDFYEMLPISKSSVGFFVCDVMGHGVRASLVVSMLRGLMEKERKSAASPERFLQGINDGLVSILERAGVTFFATAVYCVVNLRDGTLSYSCAGHPDPIVVKSGKAKQLVSEKGSKSPALGLLPDRSYRSQTISLDEVDRLLIFTDGLHEVENAEGEQLGIEHVVEMLSNNRGMSLEDCLEEILEKARGHAENGEFGDDVCFLGMDVGSSS